MKNNWTREETIIAFNVYCKIPFKDSSKNHPMIVKYAKIIGRTPSALNMKVGNLGRLDPKLQEKGIVGLSHGSKVEKMVWDEFYANPDKLVYESECLIAKYSNDSIEHTSEIDLANLPQGTDRLALIKQRVNQSFFRNAVLSSYNSTCCISGIRNEKLVEACHISDWKSDVKNRTNPHNGICLNPFFHKAYDRFYISITPDYCIEISDRLLDDISDDVTRTYLQHINKRPIFLPEKFAPDKDLLQSHYRQYKETL